MRKACERSKKGPRKVRGKALPVAFNGYFKLTDSAVTGNKAVNKGGGVFNSGDAYEFVSSGNSFSRNSAPYGPNSFP